MKSSYLEGDTGEEHKLPLNVLRIIIQAKDTPENREALQKARRYLENMSLAKPNVIKCEVVRIESMVQL